jgi:integrase
LNHWSECKEELDAACPIAPWQLRDLRRTFATKLASLRVAPHIVERLLNHRLGTLQAGGELSAVAEVYNRHLYIDEMREAVQLWEHHLTSLLQASDRKAA